MEDNCETCRHWDKWRNLGGSWADCKIGGSSGGEPNFPSSLAWAKDAECYGAWLSTHATHSCGQWEPGIDNPPGS